MDDDAYYYPGTVVQVGANATTVHVHVHGATSDYYAPDDGGGRASNAFETTTENAVETTYPPVESVRPSHGSSGTARHVRFSPEQAPPASAPIPPRAYHATRSPLAEALAGIPPTIVSPALQRVLQGVLGTGDTGGTSGTSVPGQTASPEPPQREVSVSVMLQPSGSGTPFGDLLRQLNGSSADGVPLSDLNRHTTMETYPGTGADDTCAVCQEPVATASIVRTVRRCGHVFHATCLDQWLEANLTCPMCMQTVVPEQDEESGSTNGDDDTATQESSHTFALRGSRFGAVTTHRSNPRRVHPVSPPPSPPSPSPSLPPSPPSPSPSLPPSPPPLSLRRTLVRSPSQEEILLETTLDELLEEDLQYPS